MTYYVSESNGFKIEVKTTFDFEKSNPLRFYYLFQYHVTITNVSHEAAQLISRKWFIIDNNGKEEVIEGPGVIGKQPFFEKGHSFTYTSFCPLTTLKGVMYGHYYMKDAQGDFFTVDTPEFYFSIPEEYTI
jgi:ApaG protein